MLLHLIVLEIRRFSEFMIKYTYLTARKVHESKL